MRVCMIGGSGATGREVAKALSEMNEVERVETLGRREYEILRDLPKVQQRVVDLRAGDYEAECDVAISCLGTTKDACKGDMALYREIEVEYTRTFAEKCREGGAQHMVFLSSQGADSSSWFGAYLRQKGEVEELLRDMGFQSVSVFRPGLLGRGDDMRRGEKIAAFFVSPIECSDVGRAIALRAAQVYQQGKDADASLVEGNSQIRARVAAAKM